MNILYTELVRLLGPAHEFQPHGATLLLVGLYGQGKTTTTAKLAEWYRRKHGLRVAVIEADVHRPGAYAQLSQLLEDSTVQVYGEPETKDAPTIVRNGLKACAAADLVIVDTAGRHQLDQELVDELEQISGLTRANERWLVPHLPRFKARRGAQFIPKRKEILRRKSFHHLPLIGKKAENFGHTIQMVDQNWQ